MAIPKLNKSYSYADYLKWDESERTELIDGIPYMLAAPSYEHQKVSMKLSKQFDNYLENKKCEVLCAPYAVILDKEKGDENIKTVVEPDIMIICDKSKIGKNAFMGTPDLIVEILSPSTAKVDKFEKFMKYEKAGVKEYWIVDPFYKLVNVFILSKIGKYDKTELYFDTDKIKVSIFDDLEVDLNLVFEY